MCKKKKQKQSAQQVRRKTVCQPVSCCFFLFRISCTHRKKKNAKEKPILNFFLHNYLSSTQRAPLVVPLGRSEVNKKKIEVLSLMIFLLFPTRAPHVTAHTHTLTEREESSVRLAFGTVTEGDGSRGDELKALAATHAHSLRHEVARHEDEDENEVEAEAEDVQKAKRERRFFHFSR